MLPLAACHDGNMVQQARYDSYERAALFPDGMAMQRRRAASSRAMLRSKPLRPGARR